MLAQWGQYLLCAALAFCCWQILASSIALLRPRPHIYASAASAALIHSAITLLAFIVLATLMVAGDYSVVYVAMHTNDSLSIPYRFAATWSAHEGSMLLWSLMLAISTLISAFGARGLSLGFRSVNLLVLGLVCAGVTAFILFSSNPFEQSLPPLEQGLDLNPLLQDPGLIFHPPLLYVGYVSTVIVFSATMAALARDELNRLWAVWLRPYALFSWIFLSCGIALGSYWAYYELGWGGWWFWDPVENASFMPWLAMTALIHALAVASRTGRYISWCALLAIAAFALSMFGTFLVRSGILVSVHSFAADPQRGIVILLLLAGFIVPGLVLYVLKAPAQKHQDSPTWLSTETAILINNLLLTVACLTVFVGTMYPLVLEVLAGQRISVGTPYFNSVFVPLMLPLLALAAIAGLIRWHRDQANQLLRRLRGSVWIWSVLMLLLFIYISLSDSREYILLAAVALGLWVVVGTLMSYMRRCRQEDDRDTGSIYRAWRRLRLGIHGMHLAHLGLGVFAISVALVTSLGLSEETSMALGDSHRLGEYTFRLDAVNEYAGSNYDARMATVSIWHANEEISVLKPERRRYRSQPDNPMTEAAIDSQWFGDIFVALSSEVKDGAWGMRLQIKPGIYWIWLSVLMMACGGALAMMGQWRARRKP